MSELINISGLDKAALLAALYNQAKPNLRHWINDFDAMTLEDAQGFWSRSLFINLAGDRFDATNYDRDNGGGAAAAVIKEVGRCKVANPNPLALVTDGPCALMEGHDGFHEWWAKER